MKGIGLKDQVKVNSREFQVNTGNDPKKNIVKSEVYERGQFLFSFQDDYMLREENELLLDEEYIKSITFDSHQRTIEEIKLIFKIYEKIKQLRQYLPHFRLGKVFFYRNFFDEAIDNFQRSIELKPDLIEAYKLLAFSYMQKGLFKEAINTLTQNNAVNQKFPDILNSLGVAYTQFGNLSKASFYFNKALEVKPEYDEANFNLGVVMLLSSVAEVKEGEKVIIPTRFMRSFKELIKNRRYQDSYWQRSFVEINEILQEGKRERVLESIKRLQINILCKKNSNEIIDFFFLQFMYGGKELGYDELDFYEDMIKEEVEQHQDYADYWNELGIIHLIQCRDFFLKAISEFEKSNKLDPAFEAARRNVDLLKHNKSGFLILLRAILK